MRSAGGGPAAAARLAPRQIPLGMMADVVPTMSLMAFPGAYISVGRVGCPRPPEGGGSAGAARAGPGAWPHNDQRSHVDVFVSLRILSGVETRRDVDWGLPQGVCRLDLQQ